MFMRTLDNNYLCDPRKFRYQPFLEAPDQGHARNVSAPAESSRHDLDRVPVFNAGELNVAAFYKVALPRRLHDRLYLLDILFVRHILSGIFLTCSYVSITSFFAISST